MGIKNFIVIKLNIPTIIPLVAAARHKAIVKVVADNGGIKKSMICPNTFAIVSEEDELAKEFIIITIAINPGAMKISKGRSLTILILLPIAKVNIAKNNKEFMTGAIRV